jgi:hypothetical protein
MKEEKKFFGLEKNIFFTGLVSFFIDISSEMIYPLRNRPSSLMAGLL